MYHRILLDVREYEQHKGTEDVNGTDACRVEVLSCVVSLAAPGQHDLMFLVAQGDDSIMQTFLRHERDKVK